MPSVLQPDPSPSLERFRQQLKVRLPYRQFGMRLNPASSLAVVLRCPRQHEWSHARDPSRPLAQTPHKPPLTTLPFSIQPHGPVSWQTSHPCDETPCTPACLKPINHVAKSSVTFTGRYCSLLYLRSLDIGTYYWSRGGTEGQLVLTF